MKQYGGELRPKTGWHENMSRKEAAKRLKRRERKAAKRKIKETIDDYDQSACPEEA